MKDSAKKWVEALRSGKYKQAKNVLYDEKTGGYCCLGVACQLYNEEFPEDKVNTGEGETQDLSSEYCEVRKWLGLLSCTGHLVSGLGSLAELNDKGVDFTEIANIIEAQSDILFVKERS